MQTKLNLNKIEDMQQQLVGGRGRGRGRSRDRGRGWTRGSHGGGRGGWFHGVHCQRSNVQCYNCQRFRHYVVDCRLDLSKNEKANFVEAEEDEESTLLLTCNRDKERNQKSWYLNSGASNHMTGNKDLFCNLGESIKGSISFNDQTKV